MASPVDDRRLDLTRLRSVIDRLARSGPPSLRLAASGMDVSPRSLQRHLARQKLTYSELVDSVRSEAAQVMLRTTELPVQEIAALLGYRTPSSFARAFARWTGVAPRTYRKVNGVQR
jgi:AraC-like DNA-binding protein